MGREYVLDRSMFIEADGDQRYLATGEFVDNYAPSIDDYRAAPSDYPCVLVDELPAGTRFKVVKLTEKRDPWNGVFQDAHIEITSGKYAGSSFTVSGYLILEESTGADGVDSTWKLRDLVHPAP